MSLVRFDNVGKSFGGQPVLDGVNLRIEEGEKVGLIGRNGTGKTTVFRLILGETEPDAGAIERMRRVRVAHLAQMPHMDSTLTIFDTVMASFSDIIAMEHELAAIEREITAGGETAKSLLQRYGSLQDEFRLRGGYEFRSNAKRVLHGLGFTTNDFDLSVHALSGGQRTRLMLALVLLEDAGLLLLDEPENHLDIEAQEWLESFLLESPKAILVISHDRRMLNTVVSRVVEVERGQLIAYSGNYEFYLRQKALLREQQQKAYDQQQEFIQKEERWIERFRYKNTKASQVQSRALRLEKLQRFEAPPPLAPPATFRFGEVQRSGQWVVDAQDLSMAYGPLLLYSKFSFQVARGERVGIIGPNGSGKTTLLRHLAGRLDNAASGARVGGDVTIGHKVQVGFYEQQHENLRREFDKSCDVFTEIRNFRPDMTPERVRTFLGRFLFVGDDVFKPLQALSGGELSRVAIAKLVLSSANLLLLDEPTNHLDIVARESIETALTEFPGTILLVSHDRELIDRLVEKLVVVENGQAAIHLGNYSRYRWKQQETQEEGGQDGRLRTLQARTPALPAKKKPPRDKTEEKEARKKRKQLEEAEQHIESLEQLVRDIEEQFTRLDPADYQRARSLKEEYEGLKADLQAVYAEWERLLE